MDETVELTVRLPVALQRRVDTIAQALDHPRAWVIERAIESFVEIETIVFGKWRNRTPSTG